MPVQPLLSVLGPIELVVGETAVGLGGLRRQAILGLLVLRHPRPVAVATIVESVWGDDPPDSVRNAIQVAVSKLRQVLRPLGADIVRTGDSYAWQPGEVVVDLPEFEQQVAEGRAAVRGSDVARGVQLLAHAADRWRGLPFDGLDAPYVEGARPGLERTYRLAQADRADGLLKLGRPDESLRISSVLLRDSPYDERALSLAVTAHYAAGRSTEAIDLGRQFQRRMADELGLDPTPYVNDLLDRILNHRLEVPALPPVADAEEAGVKETGVPVVAPPDLVIGREDLLAQVDARLDAGERLVTLVGLGGIGKTTVALDLAHRRSLRGSRVVFSELETATDAPSALSRICRDLTIDTDEDAEKAMASITPEQCALLILDNAEQVNGLSGALDSILTENQTLVVLVTSRRPLRLVREVVIPVPPLAVTDDAGDWGPAADLFWTRSRQVRPSLERAREHRDVLALCELLNGVPLAIQLVAGRCRVLTPRQLLERTQRDANLVLDSPGATSPERQRTFRAVLVATIASLTEDARRLLQAQCLVDGWISVELLEDVVADLPDFVGTVEELADSGLIEIDEDGRARTPVPVREHLRGARGDDLPVTHFVESVILKVEGVRALLTGRTAGDVVADLARDDDAMTSALKRALESGWGDGAARLAVALNRYWLLSGRLTEGHRWLEEIRVAGVRTVDEATRIDLLSGTFASYLSDPESAEVLTASLKRADDIGLAPDRVLVNAWCCLASHHAVRQAPELARSCAERAASLAEQSGDQARIAFGARPVRACRIVHRRRRGRTPGNLGRYR